VAPATGALPRKIWRGHKAAARNNPARLPQRHPRKITWPQCGVTCGSGCVRPIAMGGQPRQFALDPAAMISSGPAKLRVTRTGARLSDQLALPQYCGPRRPQPRRPAPCHVISGCAAERSCFPPLFQPKSAHSGRRPAHTGGSGNGRSTELSISSNSAFSAPGGGKRRQALRRQGVPATGSLAGPPSGAVPDLRTLGRPGAVRSECRAGRVARPDIGKAR
jgi:hypothetical protein